MKPPVVEIMEEEEEIKEARGLRKMITITDEDDDKFNIQQVHVDQIELDFNDHQDTQKSPV